MSFYISQHMKNIFVGGPARLAQVLSGTHNEVDCESLSSSESSAHRRPVVVYRRPNITMIQNDYLFSIFAEKLDLLWHLIIMYFLIK